VQLYSLFNLGTRGSSCLTPRFGLFTPAVTRYLLYRRLGGPQSLSERKRKIPPAGIRSLDRAARTSRYHGPLYAARYVTCFASIKGVFSSALSIEGTKEDKVYNSVKERRDWREEPGRDIKTRKKNMRKFINVKRKNMRHGIKVEE